MYIITGTTRGLGKEIKKTLLANDKDVITINRKDMDLSNPYDFPLYIKSMEKKTRNKDIVFINNAAVLGDISPFLNIDGNNIINTINTNLISPLLFLNFLFTLKNKWMYINITSGVTSSTNKYLGLYSITKLGLKRYLDFLNIELGDTNCVGLYNYDPKIMHTDMNKKLKTNLFFKNESFNDCVPRNPSDVSEDIFNFLESKIS